MICSKHREPDHHLCLPRRESIRAPGRDPQGPRVTCLREAPGAREDGVVFVLYEFSGCFKYLKGFHRKISQKKTNQTFLLNTKKTTAHYWQRGGKPVVLSPVLAAPAVGRLGPCLYSGK